MKKALALLLAVCMLVAMNACTTGTTTPTMASSTSAASTAESTTVSTTAATETSAPTNWLKKYSPEITLTTTATIGTDRVFPKGDDPENNGMTRWIEQACGIKFKLSYIAPSSDTANQKLDLAAASGDLPDVFHVDPSRISKMVSAGQIMPIDNLIDKYASPLYKWMIQDALTQTKGTYFNPYKVDGKIYAMPFTQDTLSYWKTTFIRKDILDELGMKVPETLTDLEATLTAYHAKYPDGVGFGLSNDLSQMEVVTSAFGAYPKSWIKDANENLIYGSIQPEMKQTLETLNKWYNNGWIDKEFVVKNQDKLNEDTTKGNVLVYDRYWWSIGSPFPDMWANVPNSEMVVQPFVKGPEGKQGIAVNGSFSDGVAINVNCKNPEALIYLYNEMLDSYLRNYTDLREQMKSQGYEFKYPVTEVKEPLNKAEADKQYGNMASQMYTYNYPQDIIGYGYFNDFYTQESYMYGFTGKPVSIANGDFTNMADAVTNNTTDKLTGNAKTMYQAWNGTNPKMATTFALISNYWTNLLKGDTVVVNAFQGSPTPTMVDKQAYLDKLETETFTRIITGDLPVSAFDKFVTDWKANGGDQITKEVNDWNSSIK